MLKPLRAAGRALLRAWGFLGRAPGWHYQTVERWGHRLAEPRGVPATLINGARMVCDLGDHVERQVYFIGLYEPIEAYLLGGLLAPDMTVVDGGANVGAHTLLAATAVGARGAVHSFEPVPATSGKLATHVTDNRLRHVRVNRAALWHEAGSVTLALPPEKRDNAGAFSLRGGDPATAVKAPAIRLDDYVAEHEIERVDLVKLDVEGAELFALRGMQQMLERNRPTLLVEICRATCARFEYEPQAIWELLVTRLGYRGWAIADSSDTSGPMAGLAGVEQRNVVFYHGDEPAALKRSWSTKSVLRWARRG